MRERLCGDFSTKNGLIDFLVALEDNAIDRLSPVAFRLGSPCAFWSVLSDSKVPTKANVATAIPTAATAVLAELRRHIVVIDIIEARLCCCVPAVQDHRPGRKTRREYQSASTDFLSRCKSPNGTQPRYF